MERCHLQDQLAAPDHGRKWSSRALRLFFLGIFAWVCGEVLSHTVHGAKGTGSISWRVKRLIRSIEYSWDLVLHRTLSLSWSWRTCCTREVCNCLWQVIYSIHNLTQNRLTRWRAVRGSHVGTSRVILRAKWTITKLSVPKQDKQIKNSTPQKKLLDR